MERECHEWTRQDQAREAEGHELATSKHHGEVDASNSSSVRQVEQKSLDDPNCNLRERFTPVQDLLFPPDCWDMFPGPGIES